MSGAVKCGRCGIRYHSRYQKCPRCRARDPRPIEAAAQPRHAAPDPQGRRRPRRQADAGSSGRPATRASLASVAAAGILLLTGWVWGPGFSASVASTPTAAASPLAALMKASQPRRTAPRVERVPAELPFIDAAPAGTLAYSRGELEQALEMFERQILDRPSDAESHSNAAQVLIRLGRPLDALPLLERAVSLDEGRWAYRFNLARCRGLLGDWNGAAVDYREAARLFPGDYATLFNLAQALHRAGQDDAAVGHYREAIAVRPEDATFHLALGTSEERLGHAAQAAAAYRRFLELTPGADEAAAVQARAERLVGEAASAGTANAARTDNTAGDANAAGGGR